MNRLSSEKSPYLRQHAGNPVNWYPWGDEAFAAARREDKPIFLSVGYSTCHWCHVMAHESFEDAGVAAILNEAYVPVKVDREERPDVDRVYMAFVQATTGSGGWPMSVWLTPDGRPFYGGTYFPPASQWGRPGFADLLRELARLWRDERERVERAANGVTEHLAAEASPAGESRVPEAATLDAARQDLLASHDARYGGFGGAPKFPRPSELLFLLREHRRTGDRAALDAVARTLLAIAAGGMRDHIGGGFHRYSVDERWRVPHFEKMLYDQAQLVPALLEAGQATGGALFFDVAADTLDYVQREMTDEEGGFYSAEDAARVRGGAPAGTHASEGAFYLWTLSELEGRLGPDARVFGERYGVRAGGNAPSDPHGEFTGHNILYEARAVSDAAAVCGLSLDEAEAALRRSRELLRRVRADRPRPLRDDKILTAWNGLMIAAFARASRVLGSPVGRGFRSAGEDAGATKSSVGRGFSLACLSSARRAAAFIRSRMWDPASGRLLRRFRDGEAAIDAYAEDYAGLIFGLLELFQADGDPDWLVWALDLQRRQDELFWDGSGGGWFSTTGQDPSVLLRLKEEYDGAEPAASSVSVFNLLTLSHLGALAGSASSRIEQTFGLFAPRLTTMPRAVPMMAAALSSWHAGMSEVVIVGPREEAATVRLLQAVEESHQPFLVLVRVDPASGEASRLAALLPWTLSYGMRGGRPTAYVCRNFACDAPTTDPRELAARLARSR
jgi:uncharacterized protein YyaL (SSP411 family)